MIRRIAFVFIAVTVWVQALGGQALSASHGNVGTVPFQAAGLWGGGLNAHQHWALNTGVHFVSPDGSGAYVFGTNDNSWHQIFSNVALASAKCDVPNFVTPGSCFGVSPTTGPTQTFQGSGLVAIGACGSPQDQGTAFMYGQGFVFRTNPASPFNPANPDATLLWQNTNELGGGGFDPPETITGAVWNSGTQQITFTVTGGNYYPGETVVIAGVSPSGFNSTSSGLVTQPGTSGTTVVVNKATSPGTYSSGGYINFPIDNGHGAYRVNGNYVECDPNSVNGVIVATQTFGIWRTQDKGNSFQQVPPSSIPFTNVSPDSYVLAYDPGSGTNGAGVTNTWYAASAQQVGVSSASWNSGTQQITFTTSASSRIKVGDYVEVTSASPSAYNGLYQTQAGTGGTTIIVNKTTNPGTFSSASIQVGTIYGTNDGGTTFFEACGGPPWVQHMVVSLTGGTLFVVDGGTNGTNGTGLLWTFTPGAGSCHGTWSIVINNASIKWVAIDPKNQNNMVAMNNAGSLYWSTTGGLTTGAWSGPASYTTPNAGGDAPWLIWLAFQGYNIEFDPINEGNLFQDGGQGGWTTTFNAIKSGNFTYTSLSRGILHPVASGGIVVQNPLGATAGMQDVSACAYSIVNFPPGNCAPLSQIFSLAYSSGFGLDPYTNFLAAKTSPNLAGGSDFSGYSSDGFATFANFKPFNRWNRTILAANVGQDTSIGPNNGLVQITVDSTAQLTTWNNGQGTIMCSIASVRIVGGNALSQSGGQNSSSCHPVIVTSPTTFDLAGVTFTASLQLSGVTGAQYLFYDPTPPTDHWSNSRNITTVGNDGSGHIMICVMDSRGGGWGANKNFFVDISGVQGPTEANGRHLVGTANNISSNCTTLLNSTYSGIPYAGGGTARTYAAPGGTYAASGSYLVVMPGDNGTPRCSIDRGTSVAGWSDVALPGAIGQPGGPQVQTTITGGPYGAGTATFGVASTSGLLPSQNINIQMDDGRMMYAVIGSVNTGSSQITLQTSSSGENTGVPAGRQILTGAPMLFSYQGWINADYDGDQIVIPDTVKPNTFFYVNFNAGLLKSVGCGPLTVVNYQQCCGTSGSWLQNAATNSVLKQPKGESGHLWWIPGNFVPFQSTSQGQLWRACNGDNNTPATPPTGASVIMHKVPNWFGTLAIGVGAPAAPGRYPSIIIAGWYNPQGNINNSQFGIWRSVDDPNHGKSGPSASCNDFDGTFTATVAPNTGQGTSVMSTSGLSGAIAVGDHVIAAGLTGTPRVIASLGGGNYTIDTEQTVSTPQSMTAGGTFQLMTDWLPALPNGPKWMLNVTDISGDPYICGPIYIGTPNGPFMGSRPCIGPGSYLLERDLDPAANDNAPVGLYQAA